MAAQAVMERETWSHGGKTTSNHPSGGGNGMGDSCKGVANENYAKYGWLLGIFPNNLFLCINLMA